MELVTTGKQLFTIKNDELRDDYEVEVAVDFDYPNIKETIKQMSMFWDRSPKETAPFEEHLTFFFQVLAATALEIYIKGYEDTCGVINKFEYYDGFCKLDGSEGILIKYIDAPEIDREDFVISKQEEYKGTFEIKPFY